MKFLDKIKSLFKKEDFVVKTVNVAPTEEIPIDDKLEEETNEKPEEVKSKSDISEEQRQEILEILNSVTIDKESLAFDKIQGESETISNYAKGLLKDLSSHQDFKHEEEKQELIIRSIGSKMKLINNHGLELKNLLASLEDHYYSPLREVLNKANKKAKNEEFQKIIDDLEHDSELVKTLDSQITRVIGYDELFNSEKNPKHKDEIEKEAIKRVVHGDLNDLLGKILAAVTDRSLSVKAKIENYDPIETAKTLI